MLRFLKFCWSVFYHVASWTFLPVFLFLFRRSQWKDRPFDFARALLNDPDVVQSLTGAGMEAVLIQLLQSLTGAGMAAVLIQLQQQVETMVANAPRGDRKPPTEEDREWWLFIQDYGENPQPDMVPEYFRYVLRGGTTGSTELPTLGAVLALTLRHRDMDEHWRAEFPALFDLLEQWQEADPLRAGWNDFYMVQWFVLRDDQLVRILKGRAEIPGVVGDTCKWMLNSVSQQIPAFAEALERVGYEFPETRMGKVRQMEAPPPGLPHICPACGVLLKLPASQSKESS